MTLLDLLGWLGSFFLAICAIPQAWHSYKTKSSTGISWWLLGLWGVGEILTLIYVLPRLDWPLLFNYSCNLLSLGVIVYYRVERE